jgi:hypothetical protein
MGTWILMKILLFVTRISSEKLVFQEKNRMFLFVPEDITIIGEATIKIHNIKK